MSEIEKVLVLSTAHISEKTANIIDGGKGINGISAYPFKYGVFVYIGDIKAEKITDNKIEKTNLFKSGQMLCSVPPELIECICKASEKGCQWILFDRDAGEDERLDTFAW